MIQIIYDFIYNTFLGQATFAGVEDLAILLTFVSVVAMFACLIKLVVWVFGAVNVFKRWK